MIAPRKQRRAKMKVNLEKLTFLTTFNNIFKVRIPDKKLKIKAGQKLKTKIGLEIIK